MTPEQLDSHIAGLPAADKDRLISSLAWMAFGDTADEYGDPVDEIIPAREPDRAELKVMVQLLRDGLFGGDAP
jgi:hypothetical protein